MRRIFFRGKPIAVVAAEDLVMEEANLLFARREPKVHPGDPRKSFGVEDHDRPGAAEREVDRDTERSGRNRWRWMALKWIEVFRTWIVATGGN